MILKTEEFIHILQKALNEYSYDCDPKNHSHNENIYNDNKEFNENFEIYVKPEELPIKNYFGNENDNLDDQFSAFYKWLDDHGKLDYYFKINLKNG